MKIATDRAAAKNAVEARRVFMICGMVARVSGDTEGREDD
jgi:hypothetical protein